MVCGCCAWSATVVETSIAIDRTRNKRFAAPKARRVEVCRVFTGLEPSGEHENWCGPW
jgi:hypothetical protein